MEKTIFFNDFCANKECEEYIAWNYDGGGCEYPINCESCKLIGQSHDITEYPKNCLFLNDIQKYERGQKQALNISLVSNSVCDCERVFGSTQKDDGNWYCDICGTKTN